MKGPTPEGEKNMSKEQELKQELKEMCDEHNTSIKAMEILIKMYIEKGMTEKEAITYAIGLFKNGTIQQIKLIGKDGEVL